MVVADMTCGKCGNIIAMVEGVYLHDDKLTDERCTAVPHDSEIPDTSDTIAEEVVVVNMTWDGMNAVERAEVIDKVLCRLSWETYGNTNWLQEKRNWSCKCAGCVRRKMKTVVVEGPDE